MRKFIKYALVLFFISVLMGLFMSQILKNGEKIISAQNISGNTSEVGGASNFIVQTSMNEEKILPNATITFETSYEDCKHTSIEEGEIPNNMVNMSKEEVKEAYSDCILREFSDSKVYLYKLSEGICNEHYKITIDNNMIVVYNLTSNYDTKLYKKTNITTEYLPEEDIEKLKSGIYVYGEKELNSTLESYE